MTDKKGITIYDIAREANVSPATVSRVLTRNTRVSPEKRAIVERLIKKYNFRPNAMARSLSDTHTRILGILVADIRNPYYAALVVECEKAANKRGYTVLLSNALHNYALEDSNLEKLYEQRVDAIIQMGCRADDLVSDKKYVAHVNRISRNIPYITTGKLDGLNCYRVNIDDTEAMKLVIEYLVSLGHRTIALLGGEKSVASTYNKWQQYIYLLGKHNLPFHNEYMQEGDYTVEGGYYGMSRLFERDEVPTAVIAINDYTAMGVLKAVNEKGLSVPDNISVISFDNTFLSEITIPKLTSVDYDYEKFGEILVDMAIKAIHNQATEKERLIAPKLVIRESCRPPQH